MRFVVRAFRDQDCYEYYRPIIEKEYDDFRLAIRLASDLGHDFAKTVYDKISKNTVFIYRYEADFCRYLGTYLIISNAKTRANFIIDAFFKKLGTTRASVKSNGKYKAVLSYYDEDFKELSTDLDDFLSTRRDLIPFYENMLSACYSLYSIVDSIYWCSGGEELGYSLVNGEAVIRKGYIL